MVPKNGARLIRKRIQEESKQKPIETKQEQTRTKGKINTTMEYKKNSKDQHERNKIAQGQNKHIMLDKYSN